MIDLSIKLLLAHVLGDFLLQPNHWVDDKLRNRLKSKYFYLHGLIHFLCLQVILGFNSTYLTSAIYIVLSHLLIDYIKLRLDSLINPRLLFFIDQGLHLLIIALVVYLHHPFIIPLKEFFHTKILLLILAILLVSVFSSIVMKIIMDRWKLPEDDSNDSLENAGKYIGIIERLFVFAFILMNQWSAIGLLIAAKSVFRFSDLSRAKDRKLTEYILIGTLTSFGLAISIGLFYQKMLAHL